MASLSDSAAVADVVIDVITLAEAEPIWRALEQEAQASPYQRFDWVAAFAATDTTAIRHAVLHLRRPSGETMALMGVCVRARSGLRVAEFIGGKQANLHMPLLADGVDITPAAWAQHLSDAATRLGGVDLFELINQPLIWNGNPNALTQAGPTISPEGVYALALDADSETTLKRVLSKDTRKKLRQKGQKLESLGPTALLHAAQPDEIAAILDAFFTQKAARFRELGIDDPFGNVETQAFLQLAALPGGEEWPALELYALTVNGRVVATMGGVRDARRFSGMFLSFEAEPEIARNSPGEQLVMRVIADCCTKGLAVFDLGVGEARYKTMFCETREPMATTAVATSLKGRIAVTTLRVGWRLKQELKSRPKLLAFLRKFKAKL